MSMGISGVGGGGPAITSGASKVAAPKGGGMGGGVKVSAPAPKADFSSLIQALSKATGKGGKVNTFV